MYVRFLSIFLLLSVISCSTTKLNTQMPKTINEKPAIVEPSEPVVIESQMGAKPDFDYDSALENLKQYKILNNTLWQELNDESLQDAMMNNKLIMIYIDANDCVSCDMMEISIFNNVDVNMILNTRFIPVRFNQNEYPELANHYLKAFKKEKINFPVIIIASPGGDLIATINGYVKVESFKQLIREIVNILDKVKKEYEQKDEEPKTIKI